MKTLIRWAVGNSPAMNVIMFALLGMGIWCGISLKREFWPYFTLDVIEVTVVCIIDTGVVPTRDVERSATAWATVDRFRVEAP